jgi:hypothetical protein
MIYLAWLVSTFYFSAGCGLAAVLPTTQIQLWVSSAVSTLITIPKRVIFEKFNLISTVAAYHIEYVRRRPKTGVLSRASKRAHSSIVSSLAIEFSGQKTLY